MSTGDKTTPNDLLDAMADAGVLDTFLHLPGASRREFEEWIGKACDNGNHRRRIEVLVMAMRSAPRLEARLGGEAASETNEG